MRITGVMRTLLYILAFLSVVTCGSGRKAAQAPDPQIVTDGDRFQDYAPDHLIIMYSQDVGKEPLLLAIKDYNAEIIYDYKIITGMAIRIPDGQDLSEAMEYFKAVKGVVSVEKDRIIHLTDPVKPRLELQ